MSKKILVLNGSSYADSIPDMEEVTARTGHFMENPENFSLVLFTGGADVDPSFYGETSPDGLCYTNPKRDLQERVIFKQALHYGIPMAGICRGLQFLNVMDGGRLFHHINHHEGCIHFVETNTGEYFNTNSLHHQMIIPKADAIVTAWTRKNSATVYYGANDLPVPYKGKDIEAAIFPAIKAFGVQYHPEMMKPAEAGFMYFYKMVRRAISLDWNDFVTAYTTLGERKEYDKSSEVSKSVDGFTG